MSKKPPPLPSKALDELDGAVGNGAVSQGTQTLSKNYEGLSITEAAAVNGMLQGTISQSFVVVNAMKEGNDFDKASAVFGMISQVSQFGALLGPKGQAASMVVGSVASIVSGVLGMFGDKPESQESMMVRILTEVMTNIVQEDRQRELESIAFGLKAEIAVLSLFLRECAVNEEISDTASLMLGDRAFLIGYVSFLDRLWYYIQADLKSEDQNTQNRNVKKIYCYCMLSICNYNLWCLVQCCYMRLGARDLTGTMSKIIGDRSNTDKSRLEMLNQSSHTDRHLPVYMYTTLNKEQRLMVKLVMHKCNVVWYDPQLYSITLSPTEALGLPEAKNWVNVRRVPLDVNSDLQQWMVCPALDSEHNRRIIINVAAMAVMWVQDYNTSQPVFALHFGKDVNYQWIYHEDSQQLWTGNSIDPNGTVFRLGNQPDIHDSLIYGNGNFNQYGFNRIESAKAVTAHKTTRKGLFQYLALREPSKKPVQSKSVEVDDEKHLQN